MDGSVLARYLKQIHVGRWEIRQSVSWDRSARRTGVPALASRQHPRRSQRCNEEEISTEQGRYTVFCPGLKKGMLLLEEKGHFCSRNYILRALLRA